jgi:fatty-acyl-CoA synthase
MHHPHHHAAKWPEKPAYIMAATGETVSYQELDRKSNQIAQLFRAIGLQAGDHIAFIMENNVHVMQIVFGAQRAGLVYTAISTHLKRDELIYIVNNSDARVLVTSSRFAALVDAARDGMPKLDTTFIVDGVLPGFESWPAAVARQPATPIADEQAGAQMLYSSGTTGMPKGIMPVVAPGAPIDQPSPALLGLAAAFQLNASAVYLSPAPLYHAAPLTFNTLVMKMGGTSIIMEKFDAEASLALIEKYRATHSQWVPIMFIRMLKLEEEVRSKYDVSSMRIAIHAAAPCPVEVKRKMIDWWGPVIWEYYGSTEGAGLTIINSTDWLAHPGSVGRPIQCGMHIVDEHGAELPPGKIGKIYFSREEAIFSYYKEPEKTSRSYNEHGWATVGDVGYADEEGFLYLSDRSDFMIISGGVNIYPQEVENLLLSHEKVADVAVFGIPNEEFGQEVKAVVQPASWADAGQALEAELISYCREKVSNIKVPRSIDFDPQLPRMDNGKLYKKQLAEKYR